MYFDFKVIITMGIILGLYFVGLGIFCLIKFLLNKRRFNKEREEHEKDKNNSL